jgi:rhodanese-related sulfurtransferase
MKKQSISRDIILIICASIVLAFGYNALSPKGIPVIRREVEKLAITDSALFSSSKGRNDSTDRPSSPAQSATHDDHADVRVIAPLHEQALAHPESVSRKSDKKDVFRVISLNQFIRLMKETKPLIFDARDSASYVKGHVKGARNADGLEADSYFDRLVPIPKDTLVVIYCNNPDCHLGRMLADFMGAIGFTNLYLYDDGWDGWEKEKMPVDTVAVSW